MIEILNSSSFAAYQALVAQGNPFTKFKIAVPSGCTYFSFFGGTWAQTLYNAANPAAPNVIVGTTPALTQSYVTTNQGYYLQLPVAPLAGSETLMMVNAFPQAATSGNSFDVSGYFTGAGKTYNNPDGTFAFGNWQNNNTTPQFNFPGAGSLTLGGSSIGAAAPCMITLEIDYANLLMTGSSQTPGGWGTATSTIGSNSSPRPTLPAYALASQHTGSATDGNNYFFAQWNRILTSTEKAAVYQQVQAFLAAVSVTV